MSVRRSGLPQLGHTLVFAMEEFRQALMAAALLWGRFSQNVGTAA
jgi:hypothetical protein